MQPLIALFALLLTGCSIGSQSAPATHPKEGRPFREDAVGYELSLPDALSESGSWTESGNSSSGPFFGSKLDTSIDPPFGQRAVSVKVHHLESACSPSLTGASQTEPLASANGKAEWGKIGLLNAYDAYIDAVCRPFTEGCTQREIFEGTCETKGGAYALCSEKDGKTVVICISQMTDNPKQAQEVFETFRWTK